MKPTIDTEKIGRTLAGAVEKIRGEVDPRMLDLYHEVFKKEVPLLARSRVAAYLLMLIDQGQGNGGRQRTAGPGQKARTERSPADAERRQTLAAEDATWLFLGAGRSRRMNLREVLSLLCGTAGLAKEDVGAIRILDSYSFVQVRSSVAEKLIATLSGGDFRGRPLAVNYARSRNGQEEALPEQDRNGQTEQKEIAGNSDEQDQ
ncbi:MAG: DbpA RNA binding domain-containing protein [Treponema sp.]|nr:DbpA RNA binding domain-containing protein [Treponema sp.]